MAVLLPGEFCVGIVGHVLIHSDLNSCPRSGLAVKHHIDIGAGVVDEDYRGNLGWNTLIINLGFLFNCYRESLHSALSLNAS